MFRSAYHDRMVKEYENLGVVALAEKIKLHFAFEPPHRPVSERRTWEAHAEAMTEAYGLENTKYLLGRF